MANLVPVYMVRYDRCFSMHAVRCCSSASVKHSVSHWSNGQCLTGRVMRSKVKMKIINGTQEQVCYHLKPDLEFQNGFIRFFLWIPNILPSPKLRKFHVFSTQMSCAQDAPSPSGRFSAKNRGVSASWSSELEWLDGLQSSQRPTYDWGKKRCQKFKVGFVWKKGRTKVEKNMRGETSWKEAKGQDLKAKIVEGQIRSGEEPLLNSIPPFPSMEACCFCKFWNRSVHSVQLILDYQMEMLQTATTIVRRLFLFITLKSLPPSITMQEIYGGNLLHNSPFSTATIF